MATNTISIECIAITAIFTHSTLPVAIWRPVAAIRAGWKVYYKYKHDIDFDLNINHICNSDNTFLLYDHNWTIDIITQPYGDSLTTLQLLHELLQCAKNSQTTHISGILFLNLFPHVKNYRCKDRNCLIMRGIYNEGETKMVVLWEWYTTVSLYWKLKVYGRESFHSLKVETFVLTLNFVVYSVCKCVFRLQHLEYCLKI